MQDVLCLRAVGSLFSAFSGRRYVLLKPKLFMLGLEVQTLKLVILMLKMN